MIFVELAQLISQKKKYRKKKIERKTDSLTFVMITYLTKKNLVNITRKKKTEFDQEILLIIKPKKFPCVI